MKHKYVSVRKLTLRNIHLLLDFYNYTPEQFIDRFQIKKNLDVIYMIFAGQCMPTQINLHRIIRLLGIPYTKLAHQHNLVPLIINTEENKWHLTDRMYAKQHQIPVDLVRRWKTGSNLFKYSFNVLANTLGVTTKFAHQLVSVKAYYNPKQFRSHASQKIQDIIFADTKHTKSTLQMLGQSMEDPYNWANNDTTLELVFDDIKHLSDLTHTIGDLNSYRYAKKAEEILERLDRCPSNRKIKEITNFQSSNKKLSDYQRKYYHNAQKCVHADKLLNKLISRYEPKARYNYDRSRKYCVLAGAHISDSRVTYLIYGLKSVGILNEQTLVTYERTVPGLADLDPEWQRLTYQNGMLGRYFDTLGHFGFHKANQYVKRCSLSRKQLRKVVEMLYNQGLSYAKILPCDQIDYWLNHHSTEYRETGGEEA